MAKEAQTAQRRRQLIEATTAVIARQGLAGTRIADVAREAGVSYGVVNFYFKSKDQLLADTLDHLAADYEAAAAEALAAAGPSAVDQLYAVIALDFSERVAGRRQIAAWTAFWSESRANAAFRKRCVAVQDRFLDMSRRLVREAMVETGRREDLDLLAAALNNLVTGLWVELQLRGATREAREEAKRVCTAYIAAIFPDAVSRDATAPQESAA
jgi:TetR/AcrR family transcriptional repressor of bet genes